MDTRELSRGDGREAQRGGIVLWLLLAVGMVVLLAVGYLYAVLHVAYSEGERSGVMQKISRKGWVIKTWEGELAMTTVPGVAPVIWHFTVRDPAAAAKVSALLGRTVVVHYSEHRGIPTTLFGDTPYFVDDVRLAVTPAEAAATVPEM